jgi:uncharacterized protein YecE (DUF72 family)
VTRSPRGRVFIGVAGWSLSRAEQVHFAQSGTHLERYASVFRGVEINSSFYRPHRTSTYAKWAASVPSEFRFSVKIPKAITHVQKLRGSEALLDEFLGEVSGLGEKLGCLLIQLPPSLQFDAVAANEFMSVLRERHAGVAVCEPRHETWFGAEAASLLREYRIARVAADPAVVPEAAVPGGWDGMEYYRMHGSPRIYYSEYATSFVATLGDRLAEASERGADAWCIFDNTVLGGAIRNALQLRAHGTAGEA